MCDWRLMKVNLKPEIATVTDMFHDMDITLQMVMLESENKYPDLKLIKQLTHKAKNKAIAIRGLLNY